MPSGPRPRLVLGIDAGSSSTRWIVRVRRGTRSGARRDPGRGAGRSAGLDAARDAGEELGRGRLGPLSGLAFLSAEGSDERREAGRRVRELAADVQAQIARSLGELRPPDAVYAGVTGLSDGDDAARALVGLLATSLDLPSERVVVVNDMALAYRCAFEPGEGVLIYAGTGSIVVHLAHDGGMVRAGGHGWMIDDAGGGFWIGRHALRTVLREADRRGAPATGALADAVYGALGSRDWPDLRRRVYGGGRSEVAALVPAVRHALAAGDPDAARIVAAAGRELARLADVLLARLDVPLPVALAGGASGLGAPLRKAVVSALPPGTEVRIAERTPVETAALLASGLG